MIEEFFKAHQHTIAAIAALATVGAVITSLWLAYSARRAERTRLRALANLMILSDAHAPIDPKTAPALLSVSITNQGKWPLRIPAMFFYWKVPFKREIMLVVPLDVTDSVSPFGKKSYPIEIAPRTSEDFFISDLAKLKKEVKRMRGANTFADRLRFASSGPSCGRMTAKGSE